MSDKDFGDDFLEAKYFTVEKTVEQFCQYSIKDLDVILGYKSFFFWNQIYYLCANYDMVFVEKELLK